MGTFDINFLLLELTGIFEETYQDSVQGIKAAVNDKDYDELEHHAHTLKGMVSNFQANELKDLCFELELAGKEKDLLPDITDRVDRLESLVGKLIEDFSRLNSAPKAA